MNSMKPSPQIAIGTAKSTAVEVGFPVPISKAAGVDESTFVIIWNKNYIGTSFKTKLDFNLK